MTERHCPDIAPLDALSDVQAWTLRRPWTSRLPSWMRRRFFRHVPHIVMTHPCGYTAHVSDRFQQSGTWCILNPDTTTHDFNFPNIPKTSPGIDLDQFRADLTRVYGPDARAHQENILDKIRVYCLNNNMHGDIRLGKNGLLGRGTFYLERCTDGFLKSDLLMLPEALERALHTCIRPFQDPKNRTILGQGVLSRFGLRLPTSGHAILAFLQEHQDTETA